MAYKLHRFVTANGIPVVLQYAQQIGVSKDMSGYILTRANGEICFEVALPYGLSSITGDIDYDLKCLVISGDNAGKWISFGFNNGNNRVAFDGLCKEYRTIHSDNYEGYDIIKNAIALHRAYRNQTKETSFVNVPNRQDIQKLARTYPIAALVIKAE